MKKNIKSRSSYIIAIFLAIFIAFYPDLFKKVGTSFLKAILTIFSIVPNLYLILIVVIGLSILSSFLINKYLPHSNKSKENIKYVFKLYYYTLFIFIIFLITDTYVFKFIFDIDSHRIIFKDNFHGAAFTILVLLSIIINQNVFYLWKIRNIKNFKYGKREN